MVVSILSLTQEPEYSQIWNLYRHKANNMNFNLTTNPQKSNDKIFRKTFKILIFGILGSVCPFLGKNEFP